MTKIIYETNEYTVKQIPLNYRIDIKKTMMAQNHNAKIDRDLYLPLDTKMDNIKFVAERYCNDYFRPITEEEVKKFKNQAERFTKINLAWQKEAKKGGRNK